VWAKIAGAASVVAAVAGFVVLAWGTIETSDEEIAVGEAPELTPSAQPAESTPPGSPRSSTQSPTRPESRIEPGRFEGVTMSFTYPAHWFVTDSVKPHFNPERGDENVVLQNFEPSTSGTEGIPPGAIKLDFSSFPLSFAPTPVIEPGYEELAVENASGARFWLRRLEGGYWHI
jgi:hypothetical protein